jgi:hypothetical protein
MSDQPTHGRRSFQFRLPTLMISVTLFCVVAGGYVVAQRQIVKERQAILDDVLSRGGIAHPDISWPNGPPVTRLSWVREWLGDKAMKWIVIPTEATTEEEERIRSLFAEAEVSRDSAR